MPNPSAMSVQQTEILEAMCLDPLFASSVRFPKILRYLAEKSFPNSKESREDRACAVLSELFYAGNRDVSNVRRDIGKLRMRAKKFAETSGFDEALTIVEPSSTSKKDIYLVTFIPNKFEKKGLDEFWLPYLTGSKPVTIIYSEPLFFHDPQQRLWIRSLHINDDRETPGQELSIGGSFKRAFNYVAIGEVRGLIELTSFFSKQGVSVDHKVLHHAEYASIPLTNLILLGAPRCNPIMRLLQNSGSKYFNYVLQEDQIVMKKKSGPRPDLFSDAATNDEDGSQVVHGLITRCSHPADKSLVVTSIASDHTQAIRRMCDLLVDRVEFDQAIPQKVGSAVSQFQYIFKLEVWGDETQARSLQYMQSWRPQDASK